MYYIVLYYTVLYCTLLYYYVLYCIVLSLSLPLSLSLSPSLSFYLSPPLSLSLSPLSLSLSGWDISEDTENQRKVENQEERGEIRSYWGFKFVEIGKFPEMEKLGLERQYGGGMVKCDIG